MVGSRQSAWPPARQVPAPARASSQVSFPPGDLTQVRPVRRSLTVPSPLSR